MRLNSLEDLDRLPASLDPSLGEEAIKATLHLAGWRGDLNKVDVARRLVGLLTAVLPAPSALAVETRRALLGWAVANADPDDLAFMDLWRQVLIHLDLEAGSLQLIKSTRSTSRDPDFMALLDSVEKAIGA